MLKILWKRGKIAPEEQFLPLSTIFYYLMLDFYVKTGIRFSLRYKRLFEITEVEITRVDCTCKEQGKLALNFTFLEFSGLSCIQRVHSNVFFCYFAKANNFHDFL